MKVRVAHLLLSTVFLTSISKAAIPNIGHPDTFLGPTLKGTFNSLLTDTSGYSFLAEIGSRNARVGGTLGFRFYDRHLLKLSGEFLWQHINYAYFSGNEDDWNNQGAIGGTYLYDFNYYDRLHPQFLLNAYYSHSASALLTTPTGVYTNSSGVLTNYTNVRRVGGADARGISPGIAARILPGTKIGIDLHYDSVRYNRKLLGTDKVVKGAGLTGRIDQQITDYLFADAIASYRQPFNYYEASLSWQSGPCDGPWRLTLSADYTNGKNALPSTSDVSLSVNYFLDRIYSPLRDEREKNELLAWNAIPAIHLPEVLVVADESVSES